MRINRIFNLFESEQSVLNGKSKQSAKNYLYKVLSPIVDGFFSDENWIPINTIFKNLTKMGIDYEIDKTFYDQNFPHTSKTWQFKIMFTDSMGRQQTLNCQLKAHGAGSVQDPLNRYDVTFLIN